jgi:hypothetical protein
MQVAATTASVSALLSDLVVRTGFWSIVENNRQSGLVSPCLGSE